MSDIYGSFVIDSVSSRDHGDAEYLYVDIPGMGTVQIKKQSDGIVFHHLFETRR
jgi:hypothetical protein